MGKKRDLSDFEHSLVVGARRAGLSLSETADLLGFTEFGVKNMKSSVQVGTDLVMVWYGGDIFVAHFGSLSTNGALIKCHRLPEYCCWSCLSLHYHGGPSTSRRIWDSVTKL